MRAGISSVPISNRKSDMRSNAFFYIEANCLLPVWAESQNRMQHIISEASAAGYAANTAAPAAGARYTFAADAFSSRADC